MIVVVMTSQRGVWPDYAYCTPGLSSANQTPGSPLGPARLTVTRSSPFGDRWDRSPKMDVIIWGNYRGGPMSRVSVDARAATAATRHVPARRPWMCTLSIPDK